MGDCGDGGAEVGGWGRTMMMMGCGCEGVSERVGVFVSGYGGVWRGKVGF